MPVNQKTVQEVIETIPDRYRGPGGAIAVLQDGELVGQHVWGFADLDQRIPLTPQTQMPICSITKQFVCAVLLDLERNPTPAIAAKGDVRKQVTDKLAELLGPEIIQNSGMTLDNLYDMQSGIRDYWAMTTLWGAHPEQEFLVDRDCPPALARTKSFHFTPGTEYSYCNVNFHVLARAIERVAGEPLDKLIADRVLAPAGMTTALLCPHTGKHPGPCVGYEGDEKHGFMPALNRMEWSGDAGLVASLTDMIAYEKFLDRSYSDPTSWYRVATEKPTFADGTPAPYHYGLGLTSYSGVDTWGHGGGLRGYRLQRRHAPAERLSVLVMFNHEADVVTATEDIFRGLLSLPRPVVPPVKPAAEWVGTFLDQDTQLAITVANGKKEGEISISYAGHPETINLSDAHHGKSPGMAATIEGDSLRIHRSEENRQLDARRIIRDEKFKDASLQGDYRCTEIESTFHIVGEGAMLYGSFDGYLGRGPVGMMKYLGQDVWVFVCPRGLDAPAPGDWTVVVRRDAQGGVARVRVGCWLARGLEFTRM
ncbi:Peptidase S12 aminopeptidase DmpB domain C [Penicillium riverlandense]|uniref:Peptidase S12 aminopeptidase DmpB domain C n=1 Tax=Penicillium riverlandense TaxID=1903569 RepID=UPI0025478A13|nr:Peptidase S12 aminopeptidase DmpB domain C [Penicillium riverlandense]KAJ5833791.1 Peptidase S12 aminopeptidase DmpB domain C [Penicillium riverlandense]